MCLIKQTDFKAFMEYLSLDLIFNFFFIVNHNSIHFSQSLCIFVESLQIS